MENKVKHSSWIASLISLCFYWLLNLVLWIAAILAPRELLWKVLLAIVFFGALAVIFSFFFLGTPRSYIFTTEGISLCFLFGHCKRYAWDAVTAIYRYSGYRSLWFIIEGEAGGKLPFYLRKCNAIPINKQTEKLLKKFWKHPIEYKER